MGLTGWNIFAIRLQLVVCRFAYLVFAWLVYVYFYLIRRHRIRNVSEVRREYRRHTREKGVTMVCANHLTMYDSIYIHCCVSSPWQYILNFRSMAWNLPAIENFKTTFFLTLFTYLSKCIPIDRFGSSEHRDEVLNRMRYLLGLGEVFTVFPEGGRSRSGRVEPENVTYGVGHVLKDFENPLVICIYFRGATQDTLSALPHKGDEFYVKVEALRPTSSKQGLRAAREISQQIVQKLKSMEDEYFQLRARAS